MTLVLTKIFLVIGTLEDGALSHRRLFLILVFLAAAFCSRRLYAVYSASPRRYSLLSPATYPFAHPRHRPEANRLSHHYLDLIQMSVRPRECCRKRALGSFREDQLQSRIPYNLLPMIRIIKALISKSKQRFSALSSKANSCHRN